MKQESFIEKLLGMVKTQAVSLYVERAQKKYANEKEIIEKSLLFRPTAK